jgi:hypothetical protein
MNVLAEIACDQFFVEIPSAKPVDHEFGIRDEKAGFEFWITAECHRLGTDTGKDLVLDLGKQIQGMAAHSLKVSQPPLSERQIGDMRRIFLKYRPDLPI